MSPAEIEEALTDLARSVGLTVRTIRGLPMGEGEPPAQSDVCRVRDEVWVVLASVDAQEERIAVLARALRTYAADSLEAHVKDLARALGALAREPQVLARLRAFQKAFRYRRGGFALPESAAAARFRVHARGLKVVPRENGAFALAGKKGRVSIPAGTEGPVEWVIARSDFAAAELAAAFPERSQAEQETLLRDLAGMKVIEAL